MSALFWIPNELNKLPELCFKFPFIPIGKSAMAFLKDQAWHILKSWYTSGGPKWGFQCCFADGLNKSLVLSVAQANHPINICASIDKVLSFLELRFSENDQETLCVLGNVCHSETPDNKKASVALPNFTKLIVRFLKLSVKCPRVFVVCAV